MARTIDNANLTELASALLAQLTEIYAEALRGGERITLTVNLPPKAGEYFFRAMAHHPDGQQIVEKMDVMETSEGKTIAVLEPFGVPDVFVTFSTETLEAEFKWDGGSSGSA